MTDKDLRAIILGCLQSVAPEAPVSTLDPAVSFNEQIDIDSVDYLNFVMSVEEALGIRIAEVDYPRMSTINGCLALLESLTKQDGELSCR